MTREITQINEDDFVIIEEFDGRGNKIRRAIRKATEKKDFAPAKIHNKYTTGAHRTKIVPCAYSEQDQWEEYAQILSRRVGLKVTAGHARPLGKYLEFELVRGIVNRVYCDYMTEDGILPVRHMVESFRHNYIKKLYEMARNRFFNMIWKNNIVIRELHDNKTQAFKNRTEKLKRGRMSGTKTAAEASEEQREFEMDKIKKQNKYNQKKERMENLQNYLRSMEEEKKK